MRRKTEDALIQADVILFVVDGRAGITPLDKHFADWLRRQKKPVILLVNKCESDTLAQSAEGEAYALGLGDPITMSAAHNIGLEHLYIALQPYFPVVADDADGEDDGTLRWADDEIDALEGDESFDFAAAEIPSDEGKPIKIAIVGRPNAGKSTLMNALLGHDRVITGPEAGLTRDAVAVDWDYDGRKFKLVDTAGLRRKSRVDGVLENLAVEDTLRAIRLAQIVVLVIDASLTFEKQDLQIAALVIREGRALVLAVNKWDAVKGRDEILITLKEQMEDSLAQVKNIPFVTLSALKGQNLDRLMKTVVTTYAMWNMRVNTGRLNRWLAAKNEAHPPPLVSGRPNRMRYMTQINIRPPTFAIWMTKPEELPASYQRYLINGLRDDYGIEGVPVRLLLRRSKNPFKK